MASENNKSKKFTPVVFAFCFLSFVGIGCGKDSGKNGSQSVEMRDSLSSPLLNLNLPLSQYLSTQYKDNPAGYKSDYEMLNYRRLEAIDPNPPVGKGTLNTPHIPGVRPKAVVIRKPQGGEYISSKDLISRFLGTQYLESRFAKFEETLTKINHSRNAALSSFGNRPSVIVVGLGPTGLLTALEAYAAGSSIIGIEQRAQYTRPQILRLTQDTIERIKYFVGAGFWEYLARTGVVSRSPNWIPNKFNKEFIRKTKLDNNEKRELERIKASPMKYELESVDIIRINHLETLLAAVIEKIARHDPEHFKIYYGSLVKAIPSREAYSLQLEIASHNATSTYGLKGDILVVAGGTGGNGSTLANALKFQSQAVSDTLYGATVAFRLPVGFDIGLRPIENREGTASVKGIAVIEEEKLGRADTFNWSMIHEQELCHDLNDVLRWTAHDTQITNRNSVLLPCDGYPLDPPWSERNGGHHFFLPRTRYFVTGGIAYLGVELTQEQFEMFRGKAQAAKTGLKQYMLVMAKKHMPREYVEGQVGRPHFALEALLKASGNDGIKVDEARVISVTEEAYSLSIFPIQLLKSNHFYIMHHLQIANEAPTPIRAVVLGDTYATTHFFTGSGAVNGLRAAISFGKALAAGGKDSDWEEASQKVSDATDKMHRKVTEGFDNPPLDGPFNKRLH